MKITRFQKILIRSKAAKLKAIRRVTQDNKGKRTAGVDNIKILQPEKRIEPVNQIHIDGKASPIKRVYIDKGKNKEKRPLGILTIKDRIKQSLAAMALEPQ